LPSAKVQDGASMTATIGRRESERKRQPACCPGTRRRLTSDETDGRAENGFGRDALNDRGARPVCDLAPRDMLKRTGRRCWNPNQEQTSEIGHAARKRLLAGRHRPPMRCRRLAWMLMVGHGDHVRRGRMSSRHAPRQASTNQGTSHHGNNHQVGNPSDHGGGLTSRSQESKRFS